MAGLVERDFFVMCFVVGFFLIIIIFTSLLFTHAKQGTKMLFRGISFLKVCVLEIAP